jgi:hypothetical protein
MRLEFAAPRKRPETAERLLAVDDVGGRFHVTPVYPRPPAIGRPGVFWPTPFQPWQLSGSEIMGPVKVHRAEGDVCPCCGGGGVPILFGLPAPEASQAAQDRSSSCRMPDRARLKEAPDAFARPELNATR